MADITASPIAVPTPARDLVIALVDIHPKSVLLLHAARKRAKEIGGTWRVLHITPTIRAQTRADSENEQEPIQRLMTQAEKMGGEVQQLQAETLGMGLAQTLGPIKHRLDLILVGTIEANNRLQRWQLRRSKWEKMHQLAAPYAQVERVLLGSAPFKIMWRKPRLREQKPQHLLYALMAVGMAFLTAVLLERTLPAALFRINAQNISLLFMTACAFSASRYGLLPGLVTAIGGALTYNYYYVPPYHSLNFLTVTKGLSMGLFFFASIFIAVVTGQARIYAERSQRREKSTKALFMLYQIASTAFSRQQALSTLREKLANMLNIEVAFFLPPIMSPDAIEVAVPENLSLDERDRAALETCWREMKTTGLAAPRHSLATWRFKPMIAPSGAIGVFAVRPREGGVLELWQGNLLAGIADQTAVIIEHLELTQSMEATRIREEREKLRSMLLSSVSHDLKTPLAGIIGSLGVHRSVGDRLSPERRAELLNDALEEAQRLDSFITNILDITRLESGRVNFRREWGDMNTVVRKVVKRLHHRLHSRKVIITPTAEAIEACMDITMSEQILQNLLDNACKYTPDGVEINITLRVEEGTGLICEVRDHGPGIPSDKLNTVFDKYARLHREDTQVAGTGLGLSICKAVLEAQGGWITAGNHPEGGAVFTFCYPEWRVAEAGENNDNVENVA